jgi:hypothetical protein
MMHIPPLPFPGDRTGWLATSALPDAPVVTDRPARMPAARRFTAARLRALAQGAYRVAELLDAGRPAIAGTPRSAC